jgi:hypothetical protein
MVLANMDSPACVALPPMGVTTAQTERLLRCAFLMEGIFSDPRSRYVHVASDIEHYHAAISTAIHHCLAQEEQRQQAWRSAPPGEKVPELEVDADTWQRLAGSETARGDRVPAVWGGNLLRFSAAGPRGAGEAPGPANSALGWLVMSGLGRTSDFMRAIFTFHTDTKHLDAWLASKVWKYATQLVVKPGPTAAPPKRPRKK